MHIIAQTDYDFYTSAQTTYSLHMVKFVYFSFFIMGEIYSNSCVWEDELS